MLFLFKFSVFTKFLFSVQFQQKRGGRAHNFSSKLSRLVRVFEEGKYSLWKSVFCCLRIGRPSWLASTWFAPADTVQKLVEQQIENGWLKIENSKFLKIGHKVLGACTRALPAPYPCSRLSLKARRPRPQLQFKHLILRVCQSAGGRAFWKRGGCAFNYSSFQNWK